MQLDQTQLDQLQEWLTARRMYPLPCTYCGGMEWDAMLIAPLWASGDAGRSIELTCRSCAHQVLFDAVRIGLVGPKPDPAAPA